MTDKLNLDLKAVTDADLADAATRIEVEMRRRRDEAKKAAIAQILALAEAHRIDLSTLKGPTPKYIYRNPDNRFEEWNGKGPRPKWIRDLLATGVKIETLKVEADT